MQARTVAEDHYNKGCLHSHTLCTESLDILQQLRDDYLTLSKEEAVDYNWTTDTTAVENIDVSMTSPLHIYKSIFNALF